MIIYVKVKSGSKFVKVIKIDDNEYIINLKERAEKGKANEELIRILSKEFNVSAKNISIKNPISRRKVIEIL